MATRSTVQRPAPLWLGLPLVAFIWLVGALAFWYLATAQPFWAPLACLAAVLLVSLVAPKWMLPYTPMLIIVPATILGVLELTMGFRLGGLDAPPTTPASQEQAPPVPTTERIGREPAPAPAQPAAPALVVEQPKVGREAPTAAPPPAPVMDTPKEGKEIAPKEQLAPAVEPPKEGKAIETVYVMQGEADKAGKEQPGEVKVGKEARP